MLEVNAVLDGRYKILDIIGKGGTSCVYLAENLRLKNRCALKEVYKDSFGLAGGTQGGLIAEAAILIQLRHTGLPVIYDIFDDDRSYYLVMEYIEGSPLNKILEQSGPQPEADVIRWGRQLCGVLQYLHTQPQPIIYRDTKPGNIMLKRDGSVTLIDFGAAREFKTAGTGDTAYIGTHGYAAPEQYGSGQTDARTDIYNLGVTLYHLVTGHDPRLPPYGVKPIREINPNLSKKLERVIQKCTQQDPENRYQSAAELLRELKRLPLPKAEKPQGVFVPVGKAGKNSTVELDKIPEQNGPEVLPVEETGLLAEEPEPDVLSEEQPEEWETTLWKDEAAEPKDESRRKKKMIGIISAACLMAVVLAGSLLVFLSNGNGPELDGLGERTAAADAGMSAGEQEVTVTEGGTYVEITGEDPVVPRMGSGTTTMTAKDAAATTKSPVE
ncbi:MAG: serine/threonine protein kinase, partial [Oscillospiraceae bacterium]|nr:serine/threonine protein kinase [Oscillospiraceae bacterium]